LLVLMSLDHSFSRGLTICTVIQPEQMVLPGAIDLGCNKQYGQFVKGFARVAYIMNPPYKYLAKYKADESQAKRNRVSIWSRTGFVTDWGFSGCVPKRNESLNC
jgi:hypothetical protein